MDQDSGFEPPPAPREALCYRYTNLAYPQPELHRGRHRRSRFYGARLINKKEMISPNHPTRDGTG